MTTTILQRIHSLAQAPANPLHTTLAKVLRQLSDTDKTPPERAHGATAALMKLVEISQEKVLAAIEGLGT